ncbi:Asp-tRNA(Asn)/Glu-tRNA(Gln) amidotransferase subunit GatA [Geoglobus acetivorans]|uniref:Glutamyl-tRNA(Gln) amidotransferase subunit A n=1 Tax=Geoglobus acetivorans TaxID=565033 RepID=A0ABZ3H2A7_GEOAI|nr:Asp-tRNA(Asn)/Glu-tRNA(Gln) amidotransferase subunit GatA [Geoglobus acetivorans]
MITVGEWKERLENEKAYDLVSELIDRIRKSKLNAYITVTEDYALKLAENFDNGKKEGKLAGIPIAIKDNISTEGVRTTCASRMLENYTPPFDAHVVERLKKEGAIIIGKTNMDEFGMGTTTENSYFGVVRNPHDTKRVAGGSSGGSAAAIAGNETVLALGTDTGGSIRCPASFTGVYGLKPTYGLVSRYGLIAYANSLEQIGPMAGSIDDLGLLLEVIAGRDDRDSTNAGREFTYSPVSKKFRVGVIEEMQANAEVKEHFDSFVETLRKFADVEFVSLPSLKYALPAYYIIAMSEASSNLARYDGVRYGFSLENLDSWSRYFSKVRAEGFGTEVKRRIMMGSYALSAGYYGKYYLKALKVRTLVIEDFRRAFEKFDVLISPTMPSTAFRIGEIADPVTMYMADVNTTPINLAGLPALSMPIGESSGLPVGLQVIGNYFEENSVLGFAKAVEKNEV